MRPLAATALLLLVVAPRVGAQEDYLAEIRKALAQIKDDSTIELSTVGRKTRRIHTRPVWFVVEGDNILLQSGKDGATDWFRNLQANAPVTARTPSYVFSGSAAVVTDPARIEEIHRLFLEKYRTAWALSFFGSSLGRGRPVVLTLGKVTPRGSAPAG